MADQRRRTTLPRRKKLPRWNALRWEKYNTGREKNARKKIRHGEKTFLRWIQSYLSFGAARDCKQSEQIEIDIIQSGARRLYAAQRCRQLAGVGQRQLPDVAVIFPQLAKRPQLQHGDANTAVPHPIVAGICRACRSFRPISKLRKSRLTSPRSHAPAR